MSPKDAKSAILDRLSPEPFAADRTGGAGVHYSNTTPLHIATSWNNEAAASLLIAHGANVNAADSHGLTALMQAKSINMANYLIRSGASTVAIFRRGPMPAQMGWWGPLFTEIFPLFIGVRISRPKRLLLVDGPTARFPTICKDISLTEQHILALRHLNCNFFVEDESGRSFMHCIIARKEPASIVLRYNYPVQQTSPFPWHLEWCAFGDLAFLRPRFADFRKKLPHETFRRILNLEPSRGWSPLCRAASLNFTDIMENCLNMGAEIDFEGCPLGSALMVASACGSFEAVKLLLRRGATASYNGRAGFLDVFSLTISRAIKRWLLVNRFSERLAIGTAEEQMCSGSARHGCLWSGIAQAKFRLIGKLEMQPHESSFDYAVRLATVRKELEGKVIAVNGDLVYSPGFVKQGTISTTFPAVANILPKTTQADAPAPPTYLRPEIKTSTPAISTLRSDETMSVTSSHTKSQGSIFKNARKRVKKFL